MQQLDKSKEADLPIGVPDPVLQNDVQWHGRSKAQFLTDQVTREISEQTPNLSIEKISLAGEEGITY